MPLLMFSHRQRLHCVRSAARVQYLSGQTAADDSLRRQESDSEQHGDVYVHPVSADLCCLCCTVCVDQRLVFITSFISLMSCPYNNNKKKIYNTHIVKHSA